MRQYSRAREKWLSVRTVIMEGRLTRSTAAAIADVASPLAGESPSDPVVAVQGGGDSTHIAALLGIAILVILGCALVVRNRLETGSTPERPRSRSPADEFLTDREKIRQLVEANGGRMKQAEIVDSVEWSKAKVSRLLTDLESDDEITKLRLGRENLICLAGYEPPVSQSSENPEGE